MRLLSNELRNVEMMTFHNGARGAPWVSKCGNPLIRPSVQTLGEGEGSPKTTRPGEAECPSFLAAEVNNMTAGSSYARFAIR